MTQAVDLQIGGMTCASCAARIEKKLNRMPGVAASVNYATEKAHVVLPEGTSVASAIETVQATGYTATLPPPAPRRRAGGRCRPRRDAPSAADGDAATAALRTRLSSRRCSPCRCCVLAMVPALQFPNWQWLSLTLAAPVVVWGAWPFHRAAALNARHGAATMDTLISLGVLAAFGWSLYALFLGGAGVTGHDDVVRPGAAVRRRSRRDLSRGRRRDHRVPAGGPLPGGAGEEVVRGRPARAARPGRQGRRGAAGRGRESACRSTGSRSGDEFVVRPGEKIATDGNVVDGSVCGGHEPADRRTGAGRGRPRRRGHRGHRQRGRTAGGARDPRRAPTPSSRRSPGSSSRRRPARPRCSGSPTGCRRSSCPSCSPSPPPRSPAG